MYCPPYSRAMYVEGRLTVISIFLVLALQYWDIACLPASTSCSSPARGLPRTPCYLSSCVNGDCSLSGAHLSSFACDCDPGWTGHECDQCCDMECAEGEVCDMDSLGSMYCKPDDDDSSGIEEPEQCSSIKTRPEASICMGLPCYQGQCTDFMTCRCDPGWTGDLCDLCCDLNCINGTCDRENPDGSMYCICHPDYMGSICNIIKPPTHCSSPARGLPSTPCSYASSCFNGDCMPKEIYAGVYDLICDCDTGWMGQNCDQCCDIACGLGEVCDLDAGGGMFCREGGSGNSTTEKVPVAECNSTMRSHVDPSQKDCHGLPCHNGECFEDDLLCQCDPGWTGEFCELCCDLDCVNGTCVHEVDSQSMWCACHEGYKGKLCNTTIPPAVNATARIISEPHTPESLWYVIGCGAGLLCVLVILLIAVPYYMYCKRFTICLRIIYYFKTPEDGDGKLFDVFVSYQEAPPGCGLSEDEKFAYRILIAKLETEMNFHVCKPLLDFPPGRPIADNIHWAIEESRRTILLISPDYVKAEWPRFAYQKAQHEMLKLQTRIVPILLRDISDVADVDPSLRHLMDSLSYLQWPGTDDPKKERRFWEHLRLSMPKKKKLATDDTELKSRPAGISNGSVGDTQQFAAIL